MPIETVRRVIIVSVSNGINDMAMKGQQRSQVGFFWIVNSTLCIHVNVYRLCDLVAYLCLYTYASQYLKLLYN